MTLPLAVSYWKKNIFHAASTQTRKFRWFLRIWSLYISWPSQLHISKTLLWSPPKALAPNMDVCIHLSTLFMCPLKQLKSGSLQCPDTEHRAQTTRVTCWYMPEFCFVSVPDACVTFFASRHRTGHISIFFKAHFFLEFFNAIISSKYILRRLVQSLSVKWPQYFIYLILAFLL